MGFDFVNTRILNATGSTSLSGSISNATLTTPVVVNATFTQDSTASKSTMVRVSGSTGIGRLWFKSGILVSSSYCEDI